jgi:cellulose synthase/poly-beta-1,6-N-acetylglucosamine synthase-like glycosyltransferase
VLDAVGAWDPFNVTEDADLGLRLARHGFRTGMITRPTYEDAPEKLKNWLPQRTRWFKGWMHPFNIFYNYLKNNKNDGECRMNDAGIATL